MNDQPDINWSNTLDEIKATYEAHRKKNKNRYPTLKFNSTPEPYAHLVKSFEEVLASELKKTVSEVQKMIPGPDLFAEMYRTRIKKPSSVDKLFGCEVYARAKLGLSDTHKNSDNTPFISNNVISTIPPSRLIIKSPQNGETVTREIIVEGEVSNANLIWIVVRVKGGKRLWVQEEGQVEEDGSWTACVRIGSIDPGDIGFTYQMRAFVNPTKLFKEGLLLKQLHWPEAEIFSDVIEVIRGPEIED